MKRITADMLRAGMLVHDEYGPATFVVMSANVSENSTTAHVRQVIENGLFLETDMLFINEDDGIWQLND